MGSQAEFAEYAVTRIVVGKYAFDCLAEGRGIAQWAFQGDQGVAQFHQLLQFRHLLDQIGRVEVLHRVDVQLYGQFVVGRLVLQAIRYAEGQVEFLLGQYFIEAVLVDGDRL